MHADLEETIHVCRDTHRLTPVAYTVDIEGEGPGYYEQFADCCKLAKAIKDAVPANESFKSRADNDTLQRKEAALKLVRNDLVGASNSPLYQFRIENRLSFAGAEFTDHFHIGNIGDRKIVRHSRPIGRIGDHLRESLAGEPQADAGIFDVLRKFSP